MLTDAELECRFIDFHIPEAGRKLIRKLREDGPVRNLQHRNDTVRTRFISAKMNRALYAESRTVELPGIFFREYDHDTLELWPQPVTIDLHIQSSAGGATRLQHTPDLFLITEGGFEIEEWREESRLERLAAKSPNRFYKDESGNWHYIQAIEYFKKLGIQYRLRSANEHPRIYLANLNFLESYNRESAPPVPPAEEERLSALLKTEHCIPHLSLVYKHKFSAGHVFQMLLAGKVGYADFYQQRLDLVDELIIYEDKVTCQADQLFRKAPVRFHPAGTLILRAGTQFVYDLHSYEVMLVGATEVICRALNKEEKSSVTLPLSLVQDLFDREKLNTSEKTKITSEYDLEEIICNKKGLAEALTRNQEAQLGTSTRRSARTVSRYRARVAGIKSHQERIQVLTPLKGGNRQPRLPPEVMMIAEKALIEHNKPSNPLVSATYAKFVTMCDEAGLRPMGQSSFYRWIKIGVNVEKREGKRMAYQKASIPFTYNYENPVHGVRPHEVVYIDSTILNILLKGINIEDLGKPVLTLAIDGATSQTRAFYVSYRPAGTEAVLMVIRDYVRRNGCLPKTLVLDNGKEFHSTELKSFCDLYGIHIRWRRRSKPRDSTMVERMIGATETELISAMDGNTICLKDPRMVSSGVNPSNFIKWTLPALHGAFNHYLFNIYPRRIHPRFGITPCAYESKLILEFGTVEHIFVAYETLFKLLTAPHSGRITRVIDPKRGVFVDGQYYWNDKLAKSGNQEEAEVRVEMWCAAIVYVCFRDQWIFAKARDGRHLEGRFRYEFEIQAREESRKKRTSAGKDRNSLTNAAMKTDLWNPENWDGRLREQCQETYHTYEPLGMVEAISTVVNKKALLSVSPDPADFSSVFVGSTPARIEDISDNFQPVSNSRNAGESSNLPLNCGNIISPEMEEDEYF